VEAPSSPSEETEALLADVREAAAVFLNAASADEIVSAPT